MFFAKKNLIGVDIGAHSVKLADIDFGRGGARLNHFLMLPSPSGAFSSGELEQPGLIAEVISNITRELGSKKKNAATAIWGSSSIVKRITIPRMEEDLVAEQVRWEAEQYIPFDLNEINLDFRILKNATGAKEKETMDLLIVAAQQDSIIRFAEAVTDGGLGLDVLDIAGFALANCFEINYGRLSGQSVLLINMGCQLTNFVVIESGEVVFCRDLAVGGQTYTTELQRNLGLSFEEAESIKISFSVGEGVPPEAVECINKTHDQVTEELVAGLDFFNSTSSAAPLSKAFVSGGGAKISGLVGHLSKKLGVSAEVLNAFNKVGLNSKFLSSSYIAEIRDFAPIAIGLGTRQRGDR